MNNKLTSISHQSPSLNPNYVTAWWRHFMTWTSWLSQEYSDKTRHLRDCQQAWLSLAGQANSSVFQPRNRRSIAGQSRATSERLVGDRQCPSVGTDGVKGWRRLFIYRCGSTPPPIWKDSLTAEMTDNEMRWHSQTDNTDRWQTYAASSSKLLLINA